MPTTELPKLHERAYARLIRQRVLEEMRRLVFEMVVPELPSIVRQAELAHDSLIVDLDNWLTTFSRVMEGVRVQMARRVSDAELAELIRRKVVSGVKVANGELNRNQLKVLLGIDVLGNDPELRALVEGFVAQNVSLIQSIPSKYFGEIEQTVLANVRAGRRAEVIESDIRKRYPKHARHAELIARDQTAKLSSQITEQRHKALGIESYIWRTAQDDRVRPGHRALEGKTCRYDKPPIVDPRTGRRENPGGDYQCRCTAEPVIPGIDDKPRRRPGVRGAKKKLMPVGVPPGYERQEATPRSKGWNVDSLARALRGAGTGFTKKQQIAIRRELNAVALGERMVSRRDTGPIANSLDEYFHRFVRELPKTKNAVRKAERAAAADWDAKMKRARTDPALARRLVGAEDLDSPDAIIAAAKEREFRISIAGRAATEKLRKRLADALKRVVR
ncbi:MAG TPA: minor capsid protein [Thermoanaerobaculia bacterium]|nr:minor capsid protein [Thermoanaerobaculia bacterium]